MADDLGRAELKIVVDDSEARQSLAKLRQEIQRSTRAGGVGGGRAQGGARENILTLERAQNRRFQIAQRIERLEERGANVSRLRARLGDATTAQAQRQFGTFRQITNELQRQVKLSEARAAREDRIAQALARQARVGGPRESILGRRGLTGSPADLAFLARQGGPRSPIGGALTIPDSPRFLEAARRAGEAQARAFQAEIGRAARAGGARSPIGGAVDIPGSPAFLAAQRRFQAQELSRSAAIGGPRSPIGGSLTIPDSPRFLEAARRAGEAQARAFQAEIGRAARAGGARSPIGGAVDIPGSPAFLEAQRRFAAQELSRAAAIGGPRSPIGGTPLLAGSPAAIRAEERLAQARQRATQAAEKAAQAEGRRIGRLNVSPVRGGLAFPGSPAFLDAALPPLPPGYFQRQIQQRQQALRRRQDITSNALIGGAFPLLFGQGIGASLGGAAGGGLGGAVGGQFGFGLSLLGTALGAQFDAIIQKATLLGQALDNPIENFAALQQGALLSSRGLERQVEALIKVGRAAEAAAIIQEDLADRFSPSTRFFIESARQQQQQADRLFTEDTTALGAFAQFIGAEANLALRRILQPGFGVGQQARPAITPGGDTARRTARQREIASLIGGEDLSAAETQKGIEATQTRRLAIQKQLAGAASDENTATAQAAKAQDAILGIREAQLQAANKLRAIPATASDEEFNAAAREARVEIEKARIEFEKLVAAQNNAARLLKRDVDVRERTTGLAPSARREAELAAGLTRARAEYDKAKAQTQAAIAADSEQGTEATQKAVKAAEAAESAFGQAWRSARQDLADYNAELAFTIQRQERVNALGLAAVQRQVADARALAATPAGTVRDTLAIGLQAREGVAAARARERDLGDQIGIARIRGDEAEANRLVGEQKIAAEQTKLALIEGSTAITDASARLRDSAQEARNSLQNLRVGNFRFLSPEEQVRAFNKARAAASLEANKAGVIFTTTGTLEERTRDFQDFANFRREERRLETEIRNLDRAAEINKSLVSSNEAVAKAVNDLVAKKWDVVVNVNGNNAQVLGDVNGALV